MTASPRQDTRLARAARMSIPGIGRDFRILAVDSTDLRVHTSNNRTVPGESSAEEGSTLQGTAH